MRWDETSGLFWLSGQEDEKMQGTLKTNDVGALELVTEERFHPLHDPNADSPRNNQLVIHGQSGSNRIKLLRCILINDIPIERFPVGLIRQTTWTCQKAFVGDDYAGEIPQKIKSAEIRLEFMNEWMPRKLRDADGLTGSVYKLFAAHKRAQLPTRWSHGTLSLGEQPEAHVATTETQNPVSRRSPDPFLRFEFDTPQPFEVIVDTVSSLQVLLTIATGKAPGIDAITVVEGGSTDATLSAHYFPNFRTVGRTIPHRRLFNFLEFGGLHAVARWLNTLHDQTPLRQALVIDQYHQPAFSTDRTSHLLAACDVYMRREWNDPGKKIRDFRRQVLEPMAERAGEAFQQSIGDVQTWTSSVTHIRNYWGVAHFQGYGTEPEDGYGIHPINSQLYLLLICCLLRDCGHSDEMLSTIIEAFGHTTRVTY